MTTRMPRESGRRPPGGTSLPETLVALGLLAGAILASIALVVLGSRQVASSGRASLALAAATSVVERLESLGFERTWTSFGCDGLRPVCVVESGGVATFSWREVLSAAPSGAEAVVTFHALDAPSLKAARSLRVTVVVRWTEGSRRRSVRLVTFRT